MKTRTGWKPLYWAGFQKSWSGGIPPPLSALTCANARSRSSPRIQGLHRYAPRRVAGVSAQTTRAGQGAGAVAGVPSAMPLVPHDWTRGGGTDRRVLWSVRAERKPGTRGARRLCRPLVLGQADQMADPIDGRPDLIVEGGKLPL